MRAGARDGSAVGALDGAQFMGLNPLDGNKLASIQLVLIKLAFIKRFCIHGA